MDVFKNGKGYAPLRKAVALILCRNDNVMEHWYKFNDMKVPVNMVCGFDQSNNNMKEVYVAMMQSAFEAKGSMTCIPFEIVGVNYEDGKERYIHLKLGCDGNCFLTVE